jgi:hypothetical protein
MEEGVILLLILFLIFSSGGGVVTFPDIDREDVSVEENIIAGNERINKIEHGNNDIYKIFTLVLQLNN